MNAPYVRLGVTLGLGAVVMFLVLYGMIGVPGGSGPALGMACLALMLVAPLGVLMLLIMPHLYRSLRANLILYAGFACLFLGAWAAMRSPALADDQASLRAAIAQHFARS
jgi:hypothetical protein